MLFTPGSRLINFTMLKENVAGCLFAALAFAVGGKIFSLIKIKMNL